METPPLAAERRQRASPLRVLVADDDRDTVETLAALLRDEGHVVHTAFNGKDVLPAVRLLRPDVIVVDLALAQMSGYAVAQAIRDSFTNERRPCLIAMSGVWKEYADQRVAGQVGFDHYLEKPADPVALLALVREARRASN